MRTTILSGALALGLMTLVPQSAAGQAWTPATSLSAPGENASQADLTVDGNGVVTAVWAWGPNRAVQASRFSGGAWSAPVGLTSAGLDHESPTVAADRRGAVTAIWTRTGYGRPKTIAASRFSGGRWSAPVDLSAASESASCPGQLTVDGTGVATVVWSAWNGTATTMQAARFSGNAWSAPLAGPTGEGCPASTVDGAGVVTVVWVQTGGLKASRLSGGVWSAPVDLVASGQGVGGTQLVASTAGVVTVVWSRTEGDRAVIQAARFSGGSWSAPVDIAPASPYTVPVVAVDASGVATAVWRREVGAQTSIQAARLSDGAWSAPVSLTDDANWSRSGLDVAVDATGVVTAAWAEDGERGGIKIQASRYAGGVWSAPADLSQESDVGGATMTVDGAGVVTAIWTRSNGSNHLVETSRLRPGR